MIYIAVPGTISLLKNVSAHRTAPCGHFLEQFSPNNHICVISTLSLFMRSNDCIDVLYMSILSYIFRLLRPIYLPDSRFNRSMYDLLTVFQACIYFSIHCVKQVVSPLWLYRQYFLVSASVLHNVHLKMHRAAARTSRNSARLLSIGTVIITQNWAPSSDLIMTVSKDIHLSAASHC